ncbi:MAG: hypothetical protein EOM03_02175 [Clostridia bacterium]|nr:hypothetical protein [Clostridia bacterium]
MDDIRKKLNLKHEHLLIVQLPPELEAVFGEQHGWTKYESMPKVRPDAVLAFAKNKEELQALLPEVMGQVEAKTIVWFAYPKKSSRRYKSDISRDVGWEGLIPFDYDPVRQIALSEDWSALRFRPLAEIPNRTERMIRPAGDE